MFRAIGRRFAVSLALAASLVVSGIAAASTGSTCVVIIVAPGAVLAGTPIVGMLVGGPVPMRASAGGQYGNLPGSPVFGYTDPTMFSFGTFEAMSGSIVTIRASDANGGSDSTCVAVY
jgi:hypothetical protein